MYRPHSPNLNPAPFQPFVPVYASDLSSKLCLHYAGFTEKPKANMCPYVHALP